jgi:hypothetical protein
MTKATTLRCHFSLNVLYSIPLYPIHLPSQEKQQPIWGKRSLYGLIIWAGADEDNISGFINEKVIWNL